ncbi:hypothetical protein KC333_g8381 [Hortaea werneckii]|nr:hypothetical protein KC333_g8381 [Hortaea werneckii]KAI7304599.1 hypothetical protein KC326_g8396 [Hortaea werneckii]
MPSNSRRFTNVYEVSDSTADELWSEVTADGGSSNYRQIPEVSVSKYSEAVTSCEDEQLESSRGAQEDEHVENTNGPQDDDDDFSPGQSPDFGFNDLNEDSDPVVLTSSRQHFTGRLIKRNVDHYDASEDSDPVVIFPSRKRFAGRLCRSHVPSSDDNVDEVTSSTDEKLSVDSLGIDERRIDALLHLAVTSEPSIPIFAASVTPKGCNRFPVFETRLHEYLEGYMKLSTANFDITETNHKVLHALSIETWQELISEMTLPGTKHLLSQAQAPTVAEWMSLPPIAGSWNPGAYIGVIITDRALHDGHDFIYVGSASSPGKGLASRTNQHLDPDYRENAKRKAYNYHYMVVDQPGRGRVEYFRKLAETRFRLRTADHVNSVRAQCNVVEQILSSWAKSEMSNNETRYRSVQRFTPWETTEYYGTNSRPPFKQDFTVTQSERNPITPEEAHQRDIDRRRNWRANQSERERQYGAALLRDYHRRVRLVEQDMMTRGATEEEVQAFRKDERAAARERRLQEQLDPGRGGATTVPEHLELRPIRPRVKRGQACKRCRIEKARCDGGSPCSRCVGQDEVCEPQELKPRKKNS